MTNMVNTHVTVQAMQASALKAVTLVAASPGAQD